jgi:hypothetical protein
VGVGQNKLSKGPGTHTVPVMFLSLGQDFFIQNGQYRGSDSDTRMRKNLKIHISTGILRVTVTDPNKDKKNWSRVPFSVADPEDFCPDLDQTFQIG